MNNVCQRVRCLRGRLFLSMGLLLITWQVYADAIFPVGCTPLMISEKGVSLSAQKPTLAMIHNLSNLDLWITHPVSDPGASAGWSSRLQSGKWSALTVGEKPFELSCIESRPGHEQQVPCESVLAICQWPMVTMPSTASGIFWAGEDMSLPALTSHLGRRGFVLPAPTQ